MSDRTSELEARVAELAESLRLVERRVSALERARPAAAAAPRRGAPPARAAPEAEAATADVTRGLSLGGRTLLVLAGAFILRALTDAGTLPAWLGVALGFAYAGAWIAMAERAGRSGQTWSAGFHGLAAVAIGFPLLFEASARFKLLSPAAAAAALALLTAVALGVAARRRLHGLAWAITVGGMPTAGALMVVSGRMVPATLYLLLLGTGALWLGYVRDWFYLRWPVALFLDLVVVVLGARAVDPLAVEGPRSALLVQGLLLALYLGSIATRTLLQQRAVVAFEVVQTALAGLAGLGGAVYVAARTGMGSGPFGVVAVALGAGAYVVAFAFPSRHESRQENFHFYATVAVAFVLAGTGLALPASILPLAWGALAVSAAAQGRRQRSRSLTAHAAVYALAAAAAAGLLGHALRAVAESPAVAWPPLPVPSVVVLLALAAAAGLAASTPRATLPERLPQLALVAALAASLAGVVVGVLVPPLAGAPGAGASPGAVAAIRTAVLSAGAVALAWMGRRERWGEAGWLAYPVVVVTGLKILVEDLPRSRPAALVLSFALFGAALILVPRLRHRRAPASGEARAPGPDRGGASGGGP